MTSSTPPRACRRVAEPGTVLVDEATRRPTEAAIEFAPRALTLKGKAEPVELWPALRVVAAAAARADSTGLEPPFVGRDREFRLLKEAAPRHRRERARRSWSRSSASPGIGKSRLAWEFEKYIDGLVEDFWWHQGRCLSYGDGVAFWALAEMVRMRARIAEEDDSERAWPPSWTRRWREFVPDAEERDWISRRSATCWASQRRATAIAGDCSRDGGCSSSGWPTDGPTVLVFEDIQWADQALLDFIEYLMEWSRDHPLLVVTLARPELFDRRAGWGVGSRAFTSLTLEPLAPETMRDLVNGMAPGLPDSLVEQIVDRAEGVPLYAVETVRMLLDRGLLERRDGADGGNRRGRGARDPRNPARADRRSAGRPGRI